MRVKPLRGKSYKGNIPEVTAPYSYIELTQKNGTFDF